ncbi:MAG: hypothetical protein AB7O66_15215 [Limisphaerales bacterium]
MTPTQTPNAPTAGRARPVEEIRIGAIRAAIWRNETESGVRHNVTFERIYRDGQEWRSTASFGRDDLLLLGKVADQAHTWIHNQGREAGAGSVDNPATSSGSSSTGAAPEVAAVRSRRSPENPLAKGRLPAAPSGV